MKFTVLLFLLLISKMLISQQKAILTPVYLGKTIKVSLEHALYNTQFMRFEIQNLSKDTLAIDLDNYWKTFYVNQWSMSTDSLSADIDERRTIIQPLTNQMKEDLLNKYRQKELRFIAPKKVIEYYSQIPNNTHQDIQIKPKEFLHILLDGQLMLTNGKAFEQIYFPIRDEEKTNMQRIITIPYPLKLEFKKMPANLVVTH